MTATARTASAGYSFDEMLAFHTDTGLNIYHDAPDKMRYVFTHLSEFMRNSVIHRDGPVRELPDAGDAAKQRAANLPLSTRLGELTLDAYVNHPDSAVDSALVVQAGRVLYEAYPRMRPVDKHILWSVTKAYVGMLVAILEDRGQVDVSKPIDTYLPEVRGSGWEGVAVRDILDMTSGIDCREGLEGWNTDPNDPYYRFEASIGYLPATPETPESTYEHIGGLPNRIPPGTLYEYTSVDTFMLAWLSERVYGLALNEALSQEIWSKIGAEADGLLSMSKRGAPGADGGISCRLRDLARFGLLFTPTYRNETSQPAVSDAYLHKIQHTGRAEVYQTGGKEFPGDDTPIFNSWQWDRVWADGDFYKGGWGGQGLHVSPARDLVVAFFGTPAPEGNELSILARAISRALDG
jgi:CubicO group peptidase (beta-lactamase class C family)